VDTETLPASFARILSASSGPACLNFSLTGLLSATAVRKVRVARYWVNSTDCPVDSGVFPPPPTEDPAGTGASIQTELMALNSRGWMNAKTVPTRKPSTNGSISRTRCRKNVSI